MIFESLDVGEVENHLRMSRSMKIRYILGYINDPLTRRVFLLTRFLNTFCRHNPVTTTGRLAGERGESQASQYGSEVIAVRLSKTIEENL